jgi:hypothetical protein
MYYPEASERAVIKADPGWFVAWPWQEDGKQGVELDPVIAWMIVHGAGDYHRSVKAGAELKNVHAYPHPIIPGGLQEVDGRHSCLKSPDGQFIAPGAQSWETEARMLADWPFDEPKAA